MARKKHPSFENGQERDGWIRQITNVTIIWVSSIQQNTKRIHEKSTEGRGEVINLG